MIRYIPINIPYTRFKRLTKVYIQNNDIYIYIYISSVYSPFSDRVGNPPHNIPFPGVLMKSI